MSNGQRHVVPGRWTLARERSLTSTIERYDPSSEMFASKNGTWCFTPRLYQCLPNLLLSGGELNIIIYKNNKKEKERKRKRKGDSKTHSF